MTSTMTDFRFFGKQFIIEFLELYKNQPCLWDVNSDDYSNRLAKNAAYDKLVAKWNEADGGGEASRERIKLKINSLRGCFRKELRKKMAMKKRGREYVPKLWYYDRLLFLLDQKKKGGKKERAEARRARENFEDEQGSRDENDEIYDDEEQGEYMDSMQDESFGDDEFFAQSTSSTNIKLENEPRPELQSLSNAFTSSTTTNYKKNRNSHDDIPDDILQELENNNIEDFHVKQTTDPLILDKCDLIAKNYAFKLRELPEEAFIMTDKFITDILCEAMLGNITRNSRIKIYSEQKSGCSSSNPGPSGAQT